MELKNVQNVRAKRFVGQADKGFEKGMSQKEQKQIIEQLKDGTYNTLVATSVAEEGLDIPSVDLVIFFEPVPSEIRTIQRRGRTGRFSKGKVAILMATGSQDEAYYWASVSKERKMQQTLQTIKGNDQFQLAKQSTLLKYSDAGKEKILVYVDTREQSSVITKLLEDMGALVKIKQLEVGDYVISDQIVIERKTVEDFLNSILDGRLFNQMVKMASNYNSPVILVEGDRNELFALRNIHRNSIIGALTSIAVNYRMPILFCDTPREIAEYIFVTAKREQLGAAKDIRLRIGRKGISLPEKQRFVAESLPSVGPSLARKLLQAFGSLKNIANADTNKLMEIEKIGEKKAKEITNVLTSPYKETD